MKRLLSPVLAGLLSSVIATPVMAWGVQGHGLIAEVAQTRLSPQAQRQVNELLALEGHQQLVEIASWADQLRERDPDLGRRSARWHYINMAEQGLPAGQNCQYQAARHCHDRNCVVAAIEDQGKRLADTTLPPAQRLEALKFVVHFVGDVHQPMHAGYGHDRGGNNLQVQYAGRGSNLHALWDSGMLRSRHWNNADYLQHLLALPAPTLNPDQPQQWAENSCRIATADGVYPQRRQIGKAYVQHHLPRIEQQLRLAGEHLGALLNQLLAGPASP